MRPEHDNYFTPDWAVRAFLKHETFEGNVWEPACGNGAISTVLEEQGYNVLSTDLIYRGEGIGGINFLERDVRCDNIITNPPYKIAEEFIRKALDCSNRKTVMLLRLAFLEGQRRGSGLFTEHPPSKVWVSCKRMTMYPSDGDYGTNGGTIAMAWYVWDKSDTSGHTKIGWIK